MSQQPPVFRMKATKELRSNRPFIAPDSAIWNEPISISDFEKIQWGHFPRDMEDRWYSFCTDPDADGRGTIHFHHSWIGDEMLRLEYLKVGDTQDSFPKPHVILTKIWWETEPTGKRWDTVGEAKKDAMLILKNMYHLEDVCIRSSNLIH